MHPLIINDEQKLVINSLVKFASDPENWYRPDVHKWVPGDRIEYTLHLDAYRCVFTNTEDVATHKIYRHLSISVPGKLYPHMIAAMQIASMFGFTGGREESGICVYPGNDWIIHVSENEGCVVIGQEIPQ